MSSMATAFDSVFARCEEKRGPRGSAAPISVNMGFLGLAVMRTRCLLLLAVGAVVATAAAPAHAILQTQTVGPVSFSTSGTAAKTGQSLAFNPFTAAAPSALTGVRIGIGTAASFSGQVGLLPGFTTSATYAGSGTPTFTFGNGTAITSSPSAITLQNNTTTTSNVVTNASGNFSGTPISTSASAPTIQSYFSSAPTVVSYVTAYSFISDPGSAATADLPIGTGTSTIFSGDLYLTYEYNDGTNPVPGPLPILGAGAAFGFSRKLRKRIRAKAS